MKHIVIMDDVAENLTYMSELLGDTYEITGIESKNGTFLHFKEEIPELILVSESMRETSSYEIIRKFKENPDFSEVPVVILADEYNKEKEIRAFQAGAADFLKIPFDGQIIETRIENIIREQQEKHQLTISAQKDGLTNLWNRKYTEEKIAYLLKEPNASGALFLLDMDNFKEINDLYGHIKGDHVLIEFANALNEFVGPNDMASRFGGDEFAIYFNGPIHINEIREKASSLIEFMESRLVSLINMDEVSVSIGIALVPLDGKEFETLYSKADKALYFVKQNGKRGFHLFRDKELTAYNFLKSEENTIDLKHLKQAIEEKIALQGVYKVPYGGFKNIYQFLARYIKRTNHQAQFLLFTLEKKSSVEKDNEDLIFATKQLGDAILSALRRGDVATRYGSAQYIVILMDASVENGEMVAKRIIDGWNHTNIEPNIKIGFEIQEIKPNDT